MAAHLVMQLARFGDLVQTKRLLLSLADNTQDEVHLLVDTSLVPLARKIYPFATVHGLPAHALAKKKPGELLNEVQSVSSVLQALKPEQIFNLNYSGLNFALAGLFPGEQVLGYRLHSGQQDKSAWSSLAFRWIGNRRPAPLNLADFWAHFHPAPVSPVAVNPEPAPGGKGIGVVLSGRHSKRSPGTDTLLALCRCLERKTGAGALFLLGTNQDSSKAVRWMKKWKGKAVVQNFVGRTDLVDLMDVITGLDAILTADTGTMHLAAHLGVPVTALFLASAWCHETGPYGPEHVLLQSILPCAPCLESGPCTNDLMCHTALTSTPCLRFMASGKFQEGGQTNVLIMRSELDALGVRYRALGGVDPDATEREALRAWAMEHLRLGSRSKTRPADFYRESDWMLP